MKTLSRHPKCAFHARYDWKITVSRLGPKFEKFFEIFFENFENVAECRKMKRGDPLGFINMHSVAKYQKTRRGDSFETLKNFRKKISHGAEKKLKGGTLSSLPVL